MNDVRLADQIAFVKAIAGKRAGNHDVRIGSTELGHNGFGSRHLVTMQTESPQDRTDGTSLPATLNTFVIKKSVDIKVSSPLLAAKNL